MEDMWMPPKQFVIYINGFAWSLDLNFVEQALRPVLNLIFYHFNCSERILKFHHVSSYLQLLRAVNYF